MQLHNSGIICTVVLIITTTLSATYTEKDLVKCENFDDCRAACGPSASFFKCHSAGYCSCLNTVGYPARCQNLNENDKPCETLCGDLRISKRCHTDAGLFCTCYQHPYINT